MARGRFALSITYLTHSEESNFIPLRERALDGFWPATWLVRGVFDECVIYDDTPECLYRDPLLAPVLFALSGPERGQATIIERCVRARSCERPPKGARA